MIEIVNKDQLTDLHKGDTFMYNGTSYIAKSEPYSKNGNIGIDVDHDNTFWNNARKYDLETKLRSLGKNIAIVAEQTGPKISGNIYGLTEHMLFVFDIFDIDTQSYLTPTERRELTQQLGLVDAPVLHTEYNLNGKTLNDILEFADGKSVLGFTNTLREGLVFKANLPGRISFKSVSNTYLLGSKE